MTKKKRLWLWSIIILTGLFVGVEIVGYGIEILSLSKESSGDMSKQMARKSIREIQARNSILATRLKALRPTGVYIVIDTAGNRLCLMKDEKVIKDIVVSCGSGDILEEPGGTRKWIFDTPRGEFSVTSKLIKPTWIKPDWAFIEEGEKPPLDYNERIDNDSLGDYALGFGDNYFIHGTLYTRLLGRNVTHGCVRVGDKDLKGVFENVPLGTRIYIY